MLQGISALIALAINTVIIDIFMSNYIESAILSFASSLIIVLISAGLFLSPIGTWIMRVQNHLHTPTEVERQRIEPIFLEIYEKAKKKSPWIPKDIQWFVLGDDELNAFAIGLHTIGIHTGLMQHCSDSEIAAVLAHEFGHIAHRDTICSVIVTECGFVVMMLKSLLLLCLRVIVIGTSFIWSLVNESEIPSIIGNYIASFLCWIANYSISVVYYICIAPSYPARRQQEYAADRYAAELGVCKPLITFLSRFPTPPLTFTLTLAQMFYGTHPKNEKRISELQKYMSQ